MTSSNPVSRSAETESRFAKAFRLFHFWAPGGLGPASAQCRARRGTKLGRQRAQGISGHVDVEHRLVDPPMPHPPAPPGCGDDPASPASERSLGANSGELAKQEANAHQYVCPQALGITDGVIHLVAPALDQSIE